MSLIIQNTPTIHPSNQLEYPSNTYPSNNLADSSNAQQPNRPTIAPSNKINKKKCNKHPINLKQHFFTFLVLMHIPGRIVHNCDIQNSSVKYHVCVCVSEESVQNEVNFTDRCSRRGRNGALHVDHCVRLIRGTWPCAQLQEISHNATVVCFYLLHFLHIVAFGKKK